MIQRLIRGVIHIFAVDQRTPKLTAEAVRTAEQCYCGSSFNAQIPYFMEEGSVEASAILTTMRETWHDDHYHQLNKDQGALIEKSNTQTEENTDERAAIGFTVPKQ
jgi:hypothetical protein